MPSKKSDDPALRRAVRQKLREVSRLMRWSGYSLALLGAGGLVTGAPDAWWVFPSWFSLALGMALVLIGTVRRVRQEREPPGLSNG